MIRRPLLNATAVEGGGAAAPAAPAAPAANPTPAAPAAAASAPPAAPPVTLNLIQRANALFNPAAMTGTLELENGQLKQQVAKLTAENNRLKDVEKEHGEFKSLIERLEGECQTVSQAAARQVAQLGLRAVDVPPVNLSAQNGETELDQVRAEMKTEKDPVRLGVLAARARELRNPSRN